jgi:hypothetical protein
MRFAHAVIATVASFAICFLLAVASTDRAKRILFGAEVKLASVVLDCVKTTAAEMHTGALYQIASGDR